MDASGDGRHDDGSGSGQPTPIRTTRGPLQVVPVSLSRGTAALIVRAYGELEVLVSDIIPDRQRRAVAQHTVEQHMVGCYAMTCPIAQGWLRSFLRRVSVNAASA